MYVTTITFIFNSERQKERGKRGTGHNEPRYIETPCDDREQRNGVEAGGDVMLGETYQHMCVLMGITWWERGKGRCRREKGNVGEVMFLGSCAPADAVAFHRKAKLSQRRSSSRSSTAAGNPEVG